MMRNIIRTLVAVACALQLFAVASANDELPYMARIIVEHATAETAGLGESVRSVLHVADPTAAIALLSAVNGLQIVGVDETTVHIEFARRPTLAAKPDKQHQRNSFVIDFDEASVRELGEDLYSKHERRPTVDEIVTYVYEHIGNKSYARGFDLASQVAESGEGDCTEHAVLLAALARSSGYTARVIIGVVLLGNTAETLAFGHAWTEIHDGTDWQIKDATLPDADGGPGNVRYLPLSTLDDEGPGYAFSMLYGVQAMPSKITGLGNPD
jgi:hypothetical protein